MRPPAARAARGRAARLVTAAALALAAGDAAAQPADTDSLPRDTAVTVGTLPNGLRYYVRANATPAKRAFLWLAVNAGSVQEERDQLGFAHFLEHMAFNGTRSFPRQELIGTLQRAGMRFGADINAYTSFDETVYMLEVPTDGGDHLAEGLTMLQEWADGGMRLDPAEVAAERGVVLGELRSRMQDTSVERAQRHGLRQLMGAGYAARLPIGSAELLADAQPGPLQRFYRDWYRPDLMAVFVVGDVDPRRMEAELRTRFGAIRGPDHPRPRVSPPPPDRSLPAVEVYRGAVNPEIAVYWRREVVPPRTRAELRAQLVERLLLQDVQRRLRALERRPDRPFIRADLGAATFAREQGALGARVLAWPTDSLERGLAALVTEIERTAQHGPAAAALAREKAALLRTYESAAAQAGATPSANHLRTYVAHFLEGGGALLDAAQELELVRALLPGIEAADVARAARFWRERDNRLALVDFPEWANARVPTPEGVTAILDSVARLALAPDSAAGGDAGPLVARAPAAGRVVREVRHAAGITEWRLSNGARVLLRPTANDPDEVLLRARSAGGSSLLHDTLFFSPARIVDRMMTEAAGLGGRDRGSLEDALAGAGPRDFEVRIDPTEESVRLAGSPRDLETLFQLLHLQFTAPRLDTAAIGLWNRTGTARELSLLDQIDLHLAGGNPRLLPPSPTLAALVDSATAMAIYRDRFGDAGDFTFTIVGAATADQVRPLVERWIASLPGTARRETPADLGVRPLDEIVQRTMPTFTVPRASSVLVYDGRFPADPAGWAAEHRLLDALAWVLRLRFTATLREQMGGTYGTQVQATTYGLPQEHYRVAVSFDAAPERMNGMLDTTFAIVEAIRAHGATEAELATIAAMQRREWESDRQRNQWWLASIERLDRLGVPFAQLAEPPAPVRSPAALAEAARRYLPATAYVNLVAVPHDQDERARRGRDPEPEPEPDPR